MNEFPRSLPWLREIISTTDTSLGLWEPASSRLVKELGDLDSNTFLILEAAVPSAANGELAWGRYLQYSIADVDRDRRLVAEASSLNYQPAEVAHSGNVAARINALGWRRSDGNHQRIFMWPEDISTAVTQSLIILSELWRIVHPNQLRWKRKDPERPGLD